MAGSIDNRGLNPLADFSKQSFSKPVTVRIGEKGKLTVKVVKEVKKNTATVSIIKKLEASSRLPVRAVRVDGQAKKTLPPSWIILTKPPEVNKEAQAELLRYVSDRTQELQNNIKAMKRKRESDEKIQEQVKCARLIENPS